MTVATANPVKNPLRYSPACEKPEPDEAETIRELNETMGKIRRKTYEDTGHAARSVHVKSHGILIGELRIRDGLSETLAQGIGAQPGNYPVLMRLSTTPGDMLPDQVSTPKGCALKILNVSGERLPGAEGAATQDFVLVSDGPTFQVKNAKRFLANLKLLAATTDKIEGVKEVVSTVMRGVEKAIEAVGGTSSKVKNMGGEPGLHILGRSFFSQAPILWGDYMAKVQLVPISPELKALENVEVDIKHNPYAHRESVQQFFPRHGGEWELRVQLCTDLDSMPIEDALTEWPENESPYVPIGYVIVPPQAGWSEARAKTVEDRMLFSPWHGLAAHRPLGSINRARKSAYEMSARFRAERNGMATIEPTSLNDLPA